MRILHATNVAADSCGGLPALIAALGEGYAAAGHQLTAVLPGERDRLEDIGATRVVTLAGPRLPYGAGSRTILDRAAVREVWQRVRPDRVEVSDRTGPVWLGREARRHGVPSAVFAHERLDALLTSRSRGALPAGLARWVADAANRRLAADFDTVVCTTGAAGEDFTRIGATNVAHVLLGNDVGTDAPALRETVTARLALREQAQAGGAGTPPERPPS